jgi:hypothetical protein
MFSSGASNPSTNSVDFGAQYGTITIGQGSVTVTIGSTDVREAEKLRLQNEITNLQKQVAELKAKEMSKKSVSEHKEMRNDLKGTKTNIVRSTPINVAPKHDAKELQSAKNHHTITDDELFTTKEVLLRVRGELDKCRKDLAKCKEELFACNKSLGEADALAMEREMDIVILKQEVKKANELKNRMVTTSNSQ